MNEQTSYEERQLHRSQTNSGQSETEPMSTESHSHDRSAASTATDKNSNQITIEMDDVKYLFTVSIETRDDARQGVVEYRRTVLWDGRTVISEPRDEVWFTFLTCPEFVEIVEANDLTSVQRGEGPIGGDGR